ADDQPGPLDARQGRRADGHARRQHGTRRGAVMRATLLFAIVVLGCSAGVEAGQVDRKVVEAVKAGNKAAAIALIQQKADVNTPEADGTTALSWAVRQGDADLTDRLLRAGADVKAANRYGVTPLYLAAL